MVDLELRIVIEASEQSVNELHVNHRFLLDFATRHCPGGVVLDYGCGAGELIRAGLQHQLDVYGCEMFYEAADVRERVADLIGSRIFSMPDGRIPFPDATFDLVVDNMVIEHVHDLDHVLSEIRRVLKPGGCVLSLFPTKEVWREGHCGVPLAHRFAGSRFGYYWLLLFRVLGMGYNKTHHDDPRLSRRKWAEHFQNFLTSYCFYRSQKEIDDALQSYGFSVSGMEREYITFRHVPIMNAWLFRRLGFCVLLARLSSRTPIGQLSNNFLVHRES